jgi:hypothetical protein
MADKSKPSKAREPGAPFPPGELDPELIALRAKIGGVGPVLCVAVLAFFGYMMFTLRADLRFSREGETPRPVESIAALTDGDHLHDRFIHVRAVPDRGFGAMVSTGEAIGGHRVTPVLGSSDRVWLYTDGNPWTAIVAYNELYQGRLRPLDDLPFADGLRSFVESQPPSPRFVTTDAAREALTSGASTIVDPAGSQLPLAADTPVILSEIARGRAELVARATLDRLDEQAWNLVLTNAGVLPPGGRAYQGTERAFWYRVPAPEGLDEIRRKLVADNLFAVDVRPVVESRTAKWGDITAGAGGLKIGSREMMWTDIDRISLSVAHRIPDDAVIVLTDEKPEAYWYLLPIYIFMGLFSLLFAWALFRSVRDIVRTQVR